MTVALKVTARKHVGTHPLRESMPEIIKPRAGGAVLLDASVTDGNSQVAMPTFAQQLFNAINSGTAGTIDAGKGLLFNVTGDAFVNYNINVQLDNTTGPFTGLFNLYFMWKWAGQNKFLNSVQLDNFNNDAWTISIVGLVSMWADDLKVFMGVDNAQDEFFWWGGDFQLLVPTTNFPGFTPIVPPPLFGVGGGPPPTFPPPTPPPIGAIPPGILVGPAIGFSGVPPSVAGFPLIQFGFGSATTPPASAAFPEQTTTYPHPPIVFSNIYTGGATPVPPPTTASTQAIALGNVYGPPIGPALPPVVPGGARPFIMASTENHEAENEEPEEHNDPEPVVEYEDAPEDEPHEPSPKPRRGRGRRK